MQGLKSEKTKLSALIYHRAREEIRVGFQNYSSSGILIQVKKTVQLLMQKDKSILLKPV